MAHPDYWKVKAAVLEAQVVQSNAEQTIRVARAKQAQTLKDAGFNPEQNHEFLDANESIVVVP